MTFRTCKIEVFIDLHENHMKDLRMNDVELSMKEELDILHSPYIYVF